MTEPPLPGTENSTESKPVLHHEFVGMMFAVTIAEVGLQVAAGVQRGHFVHFLPAYSHLVLALIMVGASWVGWSLSQSRGAQEDVRHVLHLGFLVLLTDVLLVVIYFILVRTVDFGAEQTPPYIAPVSRVSLLIVIIFSVYLFWDFITKFPFFYKAKLDKTWFHDSFTRILATLVCLGLAFLTKCWLGNPGRLHYIAADAALLCLVLLFRALKDICSAFFPSKTTKAVSKQERRGRKGWAIFWTCLFVAGMTASIVWTRSTNPLPSGIAQQIQDQSLDCKPKVETCAPSSTTPAGQPGEPGNGVLH